VTLSLSRRSARIEQAEIQAMSIECEKVGGINLAQDVCDTQVPHLIWENAHRGIENGTTATHASIVSPSCAGPSHKK
jgi:aminotransferase